MAYAKEKFFYFAVPTLEEAHGIISDRTFSYTEGLIGQGIYCFKEKNRVRLILLYIIIVVYYV